MAVFYVLPPRSVVGTIIARQVGAYLPGLPLSAEICLDWLHQSVTGRDYLVFREDLPDGEPVADALREGFGAESGDEIREVILSSRPETPRIRTSILQEAATALQALDSL